MRAMAFGLGIGITMAILVTLGVVAGRALDARAGTDPLFTVAGLLLGLGAGIYVLIRQSLGAGGEGDRTKGDDTRAGGGRA